jgi:hypothetical protein
MSRPVEDALRTNRLETKRQTKENMYPAIFADKTLKDRKIWNRP